MVGTVHALKMRGTFIFQLAHGELAALRIRDANIVQLAPGELGRGIITFQQVSSKLVEVPLPSSGFLVKW